MMARLVGQVEVVDVVLDQSPPIEQPAQVGALVEGHPRAHGCELGGARSVVPPHGFVDGGVTLTIERPDIDEPHVEDTAGLGHERRQSAGRRQRGDQGLFVGSDGLTDGGTALGTRGCGVVAQIQVGVHGPPIARLPAGAVVVGSSNLLR